MRLINIAEYVVLGAIIYTYFQGKAIGHHIILIVSLLIFFITSGGAWALNQEYLKEYKKYKIWIELVAIIIALMVIGYVWLI